MINDAANRVARSDRRLPSNLVILFARQSPDEFLGNTLVTSFCEIGIEFKEILSFM